MNLAWRKGVSDANVMSLANGCPTLRTLKLSGCALIMGMFWSYSWNLNVKIDCLYWNKKAQMNPYIINIWCWIGSFGSAATYRQLIVMRSTIRRDRRLADYCENRYISNNIFCVFENRDGVIFWLIMKFSNLNILCIPSLSLAC